ncbi:MAG: hypothetical protein F4X60_11595 [Gemmatimonadetes bacterium]|nr:hypothetical protein [Gemmatimonadota bacterium]MYB99181.1 hypothetical protein [Gemmatimonadota bacterium]
MYEPATHGIRRARNGGSRPPDAPAHRGGFRLLLLLSMAGLLTCDWITSLGNDPPGVLGTIPAQVVEVDSAVVLDVAAYFTDPDGDSLTYDAVSADPGTAAAGVSGSLLAVTGVAKGETRVTVAAEDPDGLAAEQSFAVTVPNRGPVVADTIPDGEVFVDSVLVIDAAVHFTDPDGDDLEFSAGSSDPTRATVAVSESTVTATGMAVGSTTVTVTARDTEGLEAAQIFEVTVPNRAPAAVGRIGNRELEVDSVAMVDVAPVFADPDRDSLVYAAVSSDPGRVMVGLAGSTLMLGGVAKGGATVTVTASDPGGLEAEQMFMVTVPNRVPAAVGAIGDRELFVGDQVEVDVAVHFADPDGDPLEFAAASSDTTRALAALSGGVVTLSGVAVGGAVVTVTARDPEGLKAELAFAVTVPNRAPEPLGTISDRDVYVGDTVTVDIAPHFREPDGEALVYGAMSSSEMTAWVAVAGGTVTVAAVAVGSATVTATARDPHGEWAEQSFAVNVPNRAPRRVGVIADREVAVDSVVVVDLVSRFAEPDGQELQYAATSSDTTRVAVAIEGSTLTVTGVGAGRATVAVTARDPGGLEAVQHFEVTVPNRAPRAVGTIAPRVVAAGTSITVDVAAHFTDPDGDALQYAATSSDPTRAVAAVSGSVVTVHGVAGGSTTVTVTARDSAGLSATQELAVTVPNQAPEAVRAIENRTLEINRSVSFDVAPYFSDPDGDGVTYSATSSNTTRVAAIVLGTTVTVSGRRTGSATITVTATDPGGLSATQSFRVRVVRGNRTPRRVGTIPDAALAAGNTLSVSVSSYFRDPDGDDLDYGAASSNPGAARAAVAGSTLSVSGVAEGGATITVTATDPGGLAATQSFDVTVGPAPPSDLVVDPPVANPHVLGPGESFTVTAVVRNGGAGWSSSETTLRYYRSSDATIGSGDTEIGTDAVPVLSPARSSAQSQRVTAPSGLGTYYYGACVDAVDNESDAGNNCSIAVAVEVTEGNRAPRAAGTIPDRTLEPGDTSSIDVAAYFTDPDADDLTYGAASSSTGVATVTRSGSTISVTAVGAGDATITVRATDTGGLTATQEFDVTVRSAVRSDLVVLSPAANPEKLGPGEAFTLSAVVHNQGPGQASSSTTLLYYRSTDATIGTGDTRIGTDAVPQLGPSRSSTESLSVTAPSTQGTYYFGACVEPVTNESDTGNNCSGAVEIEVGPANQAPRPVGSIPDRTVAVGDEISVDPEPYFTDPDADDLDYTARSSDEAIATITVSGGDIQVKGQDEASATITVTATDPGGLTATQTFRVTVEDSPNRAPYVTNAMQDVLNATPDEFWLFYPLSNVFTDPDGDDLTWTTSSGNTGVADPEISGDTLVIDMVAPGSTRVSVTATDPDGLFAADTLEITVVAARFDIDLYLTSNITEAQRAVIEDARDHWEAILAGTELNDVSFTPPVQCRDLYSPNMYVVDDHAVLVGVAAIDGPGGTIARASYCQTRLSDGTPIVSRTMFDADDIDDVVRNGDLEDVAFHEFAHGLGFTDGYFEDKSLLTTGTDPHFRGPLAIAAFNSAGGSSYTGAKVPLSSPDHAHWPESVFGLEVMTPLMDPGRTHPYSAVTLQAMADLGYVVDVSLADAYQLSSAPPPDVAVDTTQQVYDLSNDFERGPVMVIDAEGRVVRVMPPPPGTVLPSFPRQEVHIGRRKSGTLGVWIRSRARQDPPGR